MPKPRTEPRRYSATCLATIVTELEAWIEQTEESIATCEDAEHPNQDRINRLNDRLDSLTEAHDILEELLNA